MIHKKIKSIEFLVPSSRFLQRFHFPGINPADLKGTHTAVFMSSAQSDSDNVFDYEVAGDGFGVVGHNRSMLATRVSYYLDINGKH